MSPITTHVLDQASGLPARGVTVILGLRGDGGAWSQLGVGFTDQDGRCRDLLPKGHALRPGLYHLWFDVTSYFADQGLAHFFPEVQLAFTVVDPAAHYHVPLLLGPFGYTTYRGS